MNYGTSLTLFIEQFIFHKVIHLKKPEEIKIMQEGGKRLKAVVDKLIPWIKVGMTTEMVDKEAERLVISFGGEPSFKKVNNYFWTTCLPINEQIVHTPPSERILKDKDILTVDIGMYYRGYHTDYADTIAFGKIDNDTVKFLEVGRSTLKKAIGQARINQELNSISGAIEDGIYGNGYRIVKELTGHGIGKDLHEDPYVFGFRQKGKLGSIKLKAGLVIAIEVIYSISSENIKHEKNNDWSIVTENRSLSACFEKTVAITNNGTLILT